MSVKTSAVFQTIFTGKSGSQVVNNFWEISAVITFVSSLLFLKLKTQFLYQKLKVILGSSPGELKGKNVDLRVINEQEKEADGTLKVVKAKNTISMVEKESLSDSEKYKHQREQQYQTGVIAKEYDEKDKEFKNEKKEDQSFSAVDKSIKLRVDYNKEIEKIKNNPDLTENDKRELLEEAEGKKFKDRDRGY